MHFLMNLHPKMKVAAHLCFSTGSSPPCEAQVEVGGHSKGLKAVEVLRRRSSLQQRLEDGEVARSEVYKMDDVAGWTRVASLFVGHGNIYKSQRTVVTR
jgi:hypothetical protein